MLDARCDTVAEGGEYDKGDVLEAMFDATSDVEGITIIRAGHHNDEIEGVAVEFSPGFGFCAYLREARRIAQGECGIFIEELLVYTSIVFEHEGIVGIGNEEHIEDTPRHEIDKRGIFEI